jgi:dolichol-phosphate mannosyltransferase
MILVVVVPTYNEVGSLARLAEKLLTLELPEHELRVLVVDDGSTDGTAQVAGDLAQTSRGRVSVMQRGHKGGLGSAYVEGFARVLTGEADLIAQMDADLSHEPAVLQLMTQAIADADLVLASRYVAGGGVDAQWGWHRKLLSWSANRVVVPALLSLPVTDATSGFRLWRRAALARIANAANARSTGYGFQVEMAYLAHRTGARIREVPIYFRERDAGQSKMSFAVALGTVREILAVRRRHPNLPPVDTRSA